MLQRNVSLIKHSIISTLKLITTNTFDDYLQELLDVSFPSLLPYANQDCKYRIDNKHGSHVCWLIDTILPRDNQGLRVKSLHLEYGKVPSLPFLLILPTDVEILAILAMSRIPAGRSYKRIKVENIMPAILALVVVIRN